jgi:hypothetical protein
MASFNVENLTRILDQEIMVRDDQGNEVPLTVAEVNTSSLNGEEWEAFSVIYKGDAGFHIPQGTFTFCHSAFGEIALFVSPKSETEYETVVSRKRLE